MNAAISHKEKRENKKPNGTYFYQLLQQGPRKDKGACYCFRKKGWKVWWDKNISPGKAFDRTIGKALDDASCIVVLWSGHSVESDWVLEEAYEGLERKILVPVMISQTRLPFGYRRLQYIELTKWKGGASSAVMKKLLGAVEALVQPLAVAGSKAAAAKKPTPKIKRNRHLSGALDGKTIVFTGTLSESRNAHAEKVRVVGANFVGSVSAKTDYLVVGKEAGSVKLAAAAKHGVRKISEKVWLNMLNETYRRTLDGKTLVFTGKLDTPRRELDKVAKKLGGKITDSISGNTDFLIVGQNPGKAKLTAAEEYSVKIISESLWKEITDTLVK